MVSFYVLQGGKPIKLEGEIHGDCAEVALPYGGFRRWKWPRWYPDLASAERAIAARNAARIERARKLLASAESASQLLGEVK